MPSVDFPIENISPTIIRALLDLVDRIDYVYSNSDNSYKPLNPCVADKVKYIHTLLREARKDD